jgi:hypothetical protein
MIDTNQEKHTEVFSGSRSPKWVMTEDGQEKKSLFLFFASVSLFSFFFRSCAFFEMGFCV